MRLERRVGLEQLAEQFDRIGLAHPQTLNGTLGEQSVDDRAAHGRVIHGAQLIVGRTQSRHEPVLVLRRWCGQPELVDDDQVDVFGGVMRAREVEDGELLGLGHVGRVIHGQAPMVRGAGSQGLLEALTPRVERFCREALADAYEERHRVTSTRAELVAQLLERRADLGVGIALEEG